MSQLSYIAHRREEDGQEQSVYDHLRGVAKLAEQFAEPFGAGQQAKWMGWAHDIGKYSRQFQRRIRENGPKVDHATAGAKELMALGMPWAALGCAGHHGGIPDGGGPGDGVDMPTLMGRYKRQVPEYAAYAQEVTLAKVQPPPFSGPFEATFVVRMLYSCLVDADYLDTEMFMKNGQVHRGGYDALGVMLERLRAHVADFKPPQNELNAMRCRILDACVGAAAAAPGIKTLTVPTGGGKTISSLAYALEHAVRYNRSRIIYVIPYTSIIEQTADVFRAIVGANNVVEHHANVDFDPKGDDDRDMERLRLSTENWDAPLIVTTNVQFFESLYANKPSRCRKLHNLADSVIIFDEAQMLPLPYLKPCLKAIEVLVRRYGVTAVLCTATQPSLEKFFGDLPVQELYPDTGALYTFFRRTSLRSIGRCTLDELAERIAQQNQALAIVNTRVQARTLYEALPQEGRFHLSTLMTPTDRRRVLAVIRERLRDPSHPCCRVAATSLVEAGVDVDFPAVFRAEAGLDSILQAAGRCNREGRRSAQESLVSVFQLDRPPHGIAQNVAMYREIAREYDDLAAPEAIRAYFDRLHDLRGDTLDQKRLIDAMERGRMGNHMPFASVAKDCKLIEQDTRNILIPTDETSQTCADVLRRGQPDRALMRRAGAYMVSVYPNQLDALLAHSKVEMISDDLAILTDLSSYDPDLGLAIPEGFGMAIFG